MTSTSLLHIGSWSSVLTRVRPKAEGYYKPLGAVMDGLGLDNYSYEYAGYSCGYAGGRYWPSQGYEGTAELQSRRGEHASPQPRPTRVHGTSGGS